MVLAVVFAQCFFDLVKTKALKLYLFLFLNLVMSAFNFEDGLASKNNGGNQNSWQALLRNLPTVVA